ncbi:MAG TPA: flagellar hook-associated protein FlgL [bacterium]|nr:flagellar hook-associated protein FlgL [bacterium]
MRVTDLGRFSTIANNLSQVTEKMLESQDNISSGKQVNKPSDNPVGMTQVLSYRSDLASLSQYVRNLDQGKAFLSVTESALNDMENLLVNAKEIAISQASGTATPSSRQTAAAQVENLYDQAVATANRKLGDRYIFAGFKTATAPFSSTGAYNGDSNSIDIQIDETSRLAINLAGDAVFKGSNDLFTALDGLRQSLATNDSAGIQNAMDTIQAAHDQVLANHTDIGARMNRIQLAQDNFSKTEVDIKSLVSNIEDLDMTKAITELTSRQTAYQASLMASSKIMQMSLVNFLS